MSQFGGAARRVCAETKEEEPAPGVRARRHGGSRNTRFNGGSADQIRRGAQRRVLRACEHEKRCSAEPFLHRQEMSVRAIKMVVHISTPAKRIPRSGSAHLCLLRGEEFFRAGRQMGLIILQTQAKERMSRLQSCGHRPRETSAAGSRLCRHIRSKAQILPLKCGWKRRPLPGQHRAERTCACVTFDSKPFICGGDTSDRLV